MEHYMKLKESKRIRKPQKIELLAQAHPPQAKSMTCQQKDEMRKKNPPHQLTLRPLRAQELRKTGVKRPGTPIPPVSKLGRRSFQDEKKP